jgi:8-oxo-dGTP diphosphatase
MRISVVTGILVKNIHNQYLLVKKIPDVGPYPDTYLTPGGGVNPGEPIDHAVLRELFEETGVTVTNLKRVIFDDALTPNWQGIETHYIMLLYTADYVSGNLQPTAGNDDQFSDVRWASVSDLNTLPLSPPLRKLLKLLHYHVR